MRFRKSVYAWAAVILAAAVAASTALSATAKRASTTPTVGFTTAAVSDPFYIGMKCGAELAAKQNNLNLLWQGSQSTSPSDEMQVFDAVLAKKPSAAILVPWDSTAFVAPVQQLMKAGTPVITVDGTLSKHVDYQNIRTNDLAAGKAAAQAMAKLIGSSGTVGIISNAPGNVVQMQRYLGFKNGLHAAAPGITILPVQFVGQDNVKAASTVSGWIAAHPDLKGVFATDAIEAQGASSGVLAAGKRGTIKVFGYDTEPTQMTALRSGAVDGLVGQSPYTEGYEAVTLMAKILHHQIDTKKIPYHNYTPAMLVTKANMNTAAAKKFIYQTHC